MKTSPRIGAFLAVALVPSFMVASLSSAAEDDDLIGLSMETTTLQVMHDLHLTPAQLDLIAKLAKETAQKMPPRKAPKVSDKLRKLYVDLRRALLDDDEEKINEITTELEDLRETEKVELDDEFDLTDAARKRAPDLLAKLTPRQVAIYVGQFADDFPDPLEKLTEALDEARVLHDKEWTDYRDQVAGQVGWLIGGLDKASETKTVEKVTALLDKANKLKDGDFKAQKAALEKTCREIAATTGPAEVVKHFMLRTLAETLANPRTPVAVAALMKKGK